MARSSSEEAIFKVIEEVLVYLQTHGGIKVEKEEKDLPPLNIFSLIENGLQPVERELGLPPTLGDPVGTPL